MDDKTREAIPGAMMFGFSIAALFGIVVLGGSRGHDSQIINNTTISVNDAVYRINSPHEIAVEYGQQIAVEYGQQTFVYNFDIKTVSVQKTPRGTDSVSFMTFAQFNDPQRVEMVRDIGCQITMAFQTITDGSHRVKQAQDAATLFNSQYCPS